MEKASFSYRDARLETVPCNLCTGTATDVLGNRDRNGLPVTSVLCRHCGLIYLSPRMTLEWYGRYYEVEYRRQMAQFHRQGHTTESPEDVFRRQLRHGAYLTEYYCRSGLPRPRRVLDIGSSTGGVLRAFAERFGSDVLGVEPSSVEADFARSHGVPTQVALAEQIHDLNGRDYDVVICTQSFNHLLDPRGVASLVRDVLSPNGVFLLECLNFLHLCRFWGDYEMAVQIDHPYMFVPPTLIAILTASGFEVLVDTLQVDASAPPSELRWRRRFGLPSMHIRLLARPSFSSSSAVPYLYPQIRDEIDRLPHRPRRQRAVRWLELQLMRWDRLREAVCNHTWDHRVLAPSRRSA